MAVVAVEGDTEERLGAAWLLALCVVLNLGRELDLAEATKKS